MLGGGGLRISFSFSRGVVKCCAGRLIISAFIGKTKEEELYGESHFHLVDSKSVQVKC